MTVFFFINTANSEELNDFIYSKSQKVPVSVSSDRIGVVAKEGITAEQINKYAENHGLKVLAQYDGGLFILGLPFSPPDRIALARSPLDLTRDGDQFISARGLVVTLSGLETPLIATDELVVQFRPGVTKNNITDLVNNQSLSIIEENQFAPNEFLLRAKNGDTIAASQRLQEMTDLVEYAQPNFISPVETREVIPNDAFFDKQWHHLNTGQAGGTPGADISTPFAWDFTQGDPSTVIAIIDEGFDTTHPDLSPNFWHNAGEIPSNNVDDDNNGLVDDVIGWNFDSCISPNQGPGCGTNNLAIVPSHAIHGTAAAGMAAAIGGNGLGVSGSCPRCSLMLIALGTINKSYTIGRAIDYARQMGAKIISLSVGYPAFQPIPAAIERAANANIVIFAAMHDSSTDIDCKAVTGGFPSLPEVIAVSGSSNRDQFGSFGYGNCMDILAPTHGDTTGTAWITTTDVTGHAGYNDDSLLPGCPELTPPPADALGYTRCFGGTSAAAPLAAGVAGLILTANPSLGPLEVRRLLQDTADKIEDSTGAYAANNGFSTPPSGEATHGWGRINAFEAVRVVASLAQHGHGGVDIFLRDNRLDWGNTEQPSNTLLESTRGYIGHWNSMDIKVDAPPYRAPPTAATFDAFTDETPSAVQGDVNRVYVRVRNRGPVTAASVTAKLLWTQFGTALPPLPPDFWSAFPGDSMNTAQWHPLKCMGGVSSVCTITNLAYSGASIAAKSGDAAQIVTFDFPAPALDPTLPNHFCLLAMVDSPQDPISPASKSSFFVDGITPNDNNITQRNYLNLATGAERSFTVQFFVRNPFETTLEAVLRSTAPVGWEVTADPINVEKPFELKPSQQTLVTLKIATPKVGDTGVVTLTQEDAHATILGGLSVEFRPK
jgi:subtilisin family serine protease